MVVLGRGSRPEAEVHLELVEEDGCPLYRRRGGGCSVVLDPGNVIVAAAFAVQGIGQTPAYFRRLNQWLIAGLAALGVQGLSQDGISDLVMGDRKVGGTCMYRPRGVLLYSASLLVSPQLQLLERYLAHPPREPAYRRGRRHLDFVRPLAAEMSLPSLGASSDGAAVDAFRQQLEEHLLKTLPTIDGLNEIS
jgi:lipoate-protein ligase A